MDNNKIIFQNIFKVYGQKKENTITALNDVSFEIDEGELVFIIGASGAGKSTILNILGGMDSSSKGEYIFFGDNVSKKNEKELAEFRRNKIGFIFQFYNLMPSLTAYENVLLAATLSKDSVDPKEILSKVGLSERLSNFPSELSGGEQQRVSIARALVKNPSLLLCDEPTGALDSKTGIQILQLLYDLAKKDKKTVIIVTHNKDLSVVGDRIITLSDGKIISNEKIDNPKKVEDIRINND